MIPKAIKRKITHIIEFIDNNEQEFLETFVGNDFSKELVTISIGPEQIHFVAVTFEGEHYCYSCSIEDYNKWFFTFPKEVRSEFYHKIKGKHNASIEK